MDEIWFEAFDRSHEASVVVLFQREEITNAEPGVAEEAVNTQGTLNGVVEGGIERGDGVIGGENMHGVAACFERFGDVSAAEFVAADIVGRVEVGEDEDAHRLLGWDEFRVTERWRQSPQPRVNRIVPPQLRGVGLSR